MVCELWLSLNMNTLLAHTYGPRAGKILTTKNCSLGQNFICIADAFLELEKKVVQGEGVYHL